MFLEGIGALVAVIITILSYPAMLLLEAIIDGALPEGDFPAGTIIPMRGVFYGVVITFSLFPLTLDL